MGIQVCAFNNVKVILILLHAVLFNVIVFVMILCCIFFISV